MEQVLLQSDILSTLSNISYMPSMATYLMKHVFHLFLLSGCFSVWSYPSINYFFLSIAVCPDAGNQDWYGVIHTTVHILHMCSLCLCILYAFS